MTNISKAGFVNLNVVRALSGFVVVVAHCFQLFVMPVAGRGAITNVAIAAAEPAVFTFFLLSGLLIALSVQKNIEKNGYFSWKSYLISRFARIYPALIASVLLCIAIRLVLVWLGKGGPMALARLTDVYPASRTEFTFTNSELLYTVLQTYAFGPGVYLVVNGPLWSLSYEVGFYLAAGLLITTLKGKGIARAVTAVLLVGLIFVSVSYQRFLFWHFGTLWLLGVCLFFALQKPRRHGILAALFLSCCAANFLLVNAKLEGTFTHNFLSSLGVVLLLWLLSRQQRVIFGSLAKMADSTYTLYLFHFPLMLFAYALIRDLHDRSPTLYFVCIVVYSLTLVPACHALAKGLENRRWWEKRLQSRRARTILSR